MKKTLLAFLFLLPCLRAHIITYEFQGLFGPTPADTYDITFYDISDRFIDASHTNPNHDPGFPVPRP